MVSLGTKVVLLGGEVTGFNVLKDIYELTSPNVEWQNLTQTLLYARAKFVAFPIPDNPTGH